MKKNKSRRTPSFAICMASVLLHPSLRADAAKYLAGKKSRDNQDQCSSTELNFWQKVLDLFLLTLSIDRPSVMDLTNIDPSRKLDPVNCDFKNRDSAWLKDTWVSYLRPIYKQVLIKWFKDTGGGPPTLENFINYCTVKGNTYEWLVWIYAMDMKQDLLLGSKSGAGRPKTFACSEAGFEDTEARGPEDYMTPTKSNKKRKLKAQLETNQTNLQDLIGVMKARVVSTSVDPIDQCFEAMEKIDSHKRRVNEDEDHTPNSKAALLEVLKKRKKKVGKRILELPKEEENEDL